MFNRGRMALGLALCVIGVALARLNEQLLGAGSPYLTVAYIVGVMVALAGLVAVASSFTRSMQQVIQCPYCFSVNPADAKRCKTCRKELKHPDDDEGSS